MIVLAMAIFFLGSCAQGNAHMGDYRRARLHLNHGVVFKRLGQIRNSQESCTYSFVVKKFEVPTPIFTETIPCDIVVRESEFQSDTYRSLVQNGCVRMHKMYSQHLLQREAVIQSMRENIDKAWKLLPNEIPRRVRKQRAPFEFMASISKFLFGTPTGEDMHRVVSQIGVLSRGLIDQGEILEAFGEQFSALANVTGEKFRNIEEHRRKADHRFNELITDLSKWRNDLKRSVHDYQFSSIQLAKFTGFVGILSQLTMTDMMSITMFEQQSILYLSALQTLTEGRLPSFMVDGVVLQNALNAVSDELSRSSSLVVSHHRLDYYYRHQLVVALHRGDFIVINLKVPVQPRSATMQLYEILVFPLPHSVNNDNASTIVRGLSQFIAIAANDDYYANLDQFQVAACNERKCHQSFPVIPRERYTCASALFYSKHDQIMKLCDVRYLVNPDRPTMAIGVDEHQFVVSSPVPWMMNCRDQIPKELPHCQLCMVVLPCFCSLHSKTLNVMPSISNCYGSSWFNETILHPVNLYVLHHFYEESPFHFLEGDKLTERPMNLSLPKKLIIPTDTQLSELEVPLNKLRQVITKTKGVNVDVMREFMLQSNEPGYSIWSQIPFVITTTILSLVVIAIFVAVVNLNVKYNELKMAMAAASLVNTAESVPILKDPHFGDSVVSDSAAVSNSWEMVYLFVAIMVTIASLATIVRCIRRWLQSRGFIRRLNVSCAVSTVVIVLENEMDRVILPLQEFQLPPIVFFIKEVRPRSIQLQYGCGSAHLIVDWGDERAILYHHRAPIAIPSVIVVPLRKSRRVARIVNSPHTTSIRLFYDDVIFFINPLPNQD